MAKQQSQTHPSHRNQPHNPEVAAAMHRRPSNLLISTTNSTTTTTIVTRVEGSRSHKWSTPRPPTPRHRTLLSPTRAADIPDIPPIPALSYFEPNTPLTVASPLYSPATRRFSCCAGAEAAVVSPRFHFAPAAPENTALATAMSPAAVYSPSSLSTRWMLSRLPSNTSLKSPSDSSSSWSERSTSSFDNSSSTSLSTAISTCPTSAPSPLLSLPNLDFLALELRSPSSIYSPLLTPSYLNPRTPPLLPTKTEPYILSSTSMPSSSSSQRSSSARASAAPASIRASATDPSSSSSPSVSTSRTTPAPYKPTPHSKMQQASRTSSERINLNLNLARITEGEELGWSALDSPVRLHFNHRRSQEPKETIKERRLKNVSAVTNGGNLKRQVGGVQG